MAHAKHSVILAAITIVLHPHYIEGESGTQGGKAMHLRLPRLELQSLDPEALRARSSQVTQQAPITTSSPTRCASCLLIRGPLQPLSSTLPNLKWELIVC